jgi:subtilisin-like proprotein convertase family protein
MRYSKFPRLVMRLAAAATLLTAFCLAASAQEVQSTPPDQESVPGGRASGSGAHGWWSATTGYWSSLFVEVPSNADGVTITSIGVRGDVGATGKYVGFGVGANASWAAYQGNSYYCTGTETSFNYSGIQPTLQLNAEGRRGFYHTLYVPRSVNNACLYSAGGNKSWGLRIYYDYSIADSTTPQPPVLQSISPQNGYLRLNLTPATSGSTPAQYWGYCERSSGTRSAFQSSSAAIPAEGTTNSYLSIGFANRASTSGGTGTSTTSSSGSITNNGGTTSTSTATDSGTSSSEDCVQTTWNDCADGGGDSGSGDGSRDSGTLYVKGSISVSVNISHSWRGDLELTLFSPSGQSVVLWTGNSLDDGTSINQSFSRSDFDGTRGSGQWSLKIQDRKSGDSGTLNSWGISFNTEEQVSTSTSWGSGQTSLNVSGLTNGATYSCYAKSQGYNNLLSGPSNTRSSRVGGRPGKPDIKVESEDETAFVSVQSVSNGGLDILEYEAVCTSSEGSKTQRSNSKNIEVTSLINGVGYLCKARARNAQDWGPFSDEKKVRPEEQLQGLPIWLLYVATQGGSGGDSGGGNPRLGCTSSSTVECSHLLFSSDDGGSILTVPGSKTLVTQLQKDSGTWSYFFLQGLWSHPGVRLWEARMWLSTTPAGAPLNNGQNGCWKSGDPNTGLNFFYSIAAHAGANDCPITAGQRYFLNWSICDAAGDATCSNTSYRNYNDVRLSISSF